jgi:hypothetical protein
MQAAEYEKGVLHLADGGILAQVQVQGLPRHIVLRALQQRTGKPPENMLATNACLDAPF